MAWTCRDLFLRSIAFLCIVIIIVDGFQSASGNAIPCVTVSVASTVLLLALPTDLERFLRKREASEEVESAPPLVVKANGRRLEITGGQLGFSNCQLFPSQCASIAEW